MMPPIYLILQMGFNVQLLNKNYHFTRQSMSFYQVWSQTILQDFLVFTCQQERAWKEVNQNLEHNSLFWRYWDQKVCVKNFNRVFALWVEWDSWDQSNLQMKRQVLRSRNSQWTSKMTTKKAKSVQIIMMDIMIWVLIITIRVLMNSQRKSFTKKTTPKFLKIAILLSTQ